MKRDAGSTRRGDRIALTLIGAALTAGAALVLLVATGAIERVGSYVDGDDSLFNAHSPPPSKTTRSGGSWAPWPPECSP